jgi:hypothetical protein
MAPVLATVPVLAPAGSAPLTSVMVPLETVRVPALKVMFDDFW